MIAVIADDFTGAAELAGIGLRYGLQVKLYTGISRYEACDVCIVSSDSRSMRKTDALEVTRNIVTALHELSPSFIYKKTDSVLRGYVLDEINVQMQITGKKRAVILPANPSLERKIISGKYYIGDQLITDTNFAKDPEFPVKSSLVTEMLGAGKDEVSVLSRGIKADQLAVSIAEAASSNDVEYWAKQFDQSFLLAGAADFFEKLLANLFPEVPANKVSLLSPHLYVCGTTATSSREVIGKVAQQSDLVVLLQEHDIVQQDRSFSHAQLDRIKHHVDATDRLLLAIGNAGTLTALQVREAMAGFVHQLLQEIQFREMFIEGGSTAAAIINRLQLSSFDVETELQRGVVRMKSGDLHITVKPGSYTIPDSIKDLYLTKAI